MVVHAGMLPEVKWWLIKRGGVADGGGRGVGS